MCGESEIANEVAGYAQRNSRRHDGAAGPVFSRRFADLVRLPASVSINASRTISQVLCPSVGAAMIRCSGQSKPLAHKVEVGCAGAQHGEVEHLRILIHSARSGGSKRHDGHAPMSSDSRKIGMH